MSTLNVKPFLRGHLHQASFFFGLGVCIMLFVIAPNATAKMAVLVYGLSLATLFGISSLYHRIHWPVNIQKLMRKLDHSAIFIFIAGTVTPVSILGLKGDTGLQLLLISWIFAILGVLKEFFWINAPRWSSGVLYVTMGWLGGPYLGQFFKALGLLNTWFLIVGGIMYTVGAIIYALKKPDPFPKVFGYHEIFHTLTIFASTFHFIVIYRLVTASAMTT